jgi:hypothetical protein
MSLRRGSQVHRPWIGVRGLARVQIACGLISDPLFASERYTRQQDPAALSPCWAAKRDSREAGTASRADRLQTVETTARPPPCAPCYLLGPNPTLIAEPSKCEAEAFPRRTDISAVSAPLRESFRLKLSRSCSYTVHLSPLPKPGGSPLLARLQNWT